MMAKVLVSSCLLGSRVRYDGSAKLYRNRILARWMEEGRIVQLCPEVAVGFETPRPPAEITGGGGGDEVLRGLSRVTEATGRDVSGLYAEAAGIALQLARQHGCTYALLTDGSPSCGSSYIYDGAFNGIRKSGHGVTSAVLRQAGIKVFSHTDIASLDRILAGEAQSG
jgi:uncharacterized protein YbbK (DUF523 family)